MTRANQLAAEGYFVVPDVLGADECTGLLEQMIDSYATRVPSVIKEPAFRRHTPLSLTPAVYEAITAVVEHGYGELSGFLRNERLLVELSSITVFPCAAAQPMHRDEANAERYLMSVFVPLADTHADAGALLVLPGSHDMETGGAGEPLALEVTAGSAIFMNSKLLHGGGANTTTDRIRPVFYVSFGEPNLYGPTYSIEPDVAARQLSLEEFCPREGQRRAGWTAHSRPQLSTGARLLTPLSDDGHELLLCTDGRVRASARFEQRESWIVDVLHTIECHPRELEVTDLARHCEVGLDDLLSALARMGRAGWVRW